MHQLLKLNAIMHLPIIFCHISIVKDEIDLNILNFRYSTKFSIKITADIL
jgi:hypothetical protein